MVDIAISNLGYIQAYRIFAKIIVKSKVLAKYSYREYFRTY